MIFVRQDFCYMMLKKYTLLFLLFSCIGYTFSQNVNPMQLSTYSQISVITSGPGDALYEKFGHSAIRVKDPVLQLDLIYNYGIFDFEDPNFYVNFTKGFMKYKLARYDFYIALKSAQQDKRWVKEQILNLTTQQKNDFFSFLENNAKPQNASYFYDPFYNNCATKPRDIIKTIAGNNLVFKSEFAKSNLSLRQLMNKEINPNTWGSLGINIALGSKLDKVAKPTEYLYLPDYVFSALKESKIKKNNKDENLVLKTNTLLDFEEKVAKSDTFSPFLTLLIFAILGLLITFKDVQKQTRTRWLDFTLFIVTGSLGVIVIYLWFFTNHSTAPNNFNIVWAFAPNLVVAFYLLKKNPPKWVGFYCKILWLFIIVIPIIWISKTQLFTYPLISLFVLLAVRYGFLQKTLKR